MQGKYLNVTYLLPWEDKCILDISARSESPLLFSFIFFRRYNWTAMTCSSDPLQQGRESQASVCLVFCRVLTSSQTSAALSCFFSCCLHAFWQLPL